ncbi:hypothetical protein L218DRAFT_947158 [Marasmius fiardii PR-910]|nr:hypothetical protein L218DRAFT_947158 [Marasmius fiardii PR-910]
MAQLNLQLPPFVLQYLSEGLRVFLTDGDDGGEGKLGIEGGVFRRRLKSTSFLFLSTHPLGLRGLEKRLIILLAASHYDWTLQLSTNPNLTKAEMPLEAPQLQVKLPRSDGVVSCVLYTSTWDWRRLGDLQIKLCRFRSLAEWRVQRVKK